jgi:hypothetical protein
MTDSPDLTQAQAAIVQRTNAFRISEGLAPVQRNAALDNAAHQFARYLAKSGRFAHEADGRKPAERAKQAGYWHCAVAENLALNLDSRGFTVEKLATDVVEGWKASAGHRKNILLPSVTDVGIGIARAMGPDPKFLTVQLLGRPGHLAYAFSITNKSVDTIIYDFAGKRHEIAPRIVVTHQACDPARVRFEGTGGWLGGTRMNVQYEAVDKAKFILRNGPEGKLMVEHHR